MSRLEIVDTDRCVGCQCCMFACARNLAKKVSLDSSRIGVRSAGGLERGFVVIVCRACPDPPCAKVCPTDALKLRSGGGVLLEADRCIGCGNCREACPIGCVYWDHEQNKPLICIHCGYCVNFCPYGVMEMENGTEDAVG